MNTSIWKELIIVPRVCASSMCSVSWCLLCFMSLSFDYICIFYSPLRECLRARHFRATSLLHTTCVRSCCTWRGSCVAAKHKKKSRNCLERKCSFPSLSAKSFIVLPLPLSKTNTSNKAWGDAVRWLRMHRSRSRRKSRDTSQSTFDLQVVPSYFDIWVVDNFCTMFRLFVLPQGSSDWIINIYLFHNCHGHAFVCSFLRKMFHFPFCNHVYRVLCNSMNPHLARF